MSPQPSSPCELYIKESSRTLPCPAAISSFYQLSRCLDSCNVWERGKMRTSMQLRGLCHALRSPPRTVSCWMLAIVSTPGRDGFTLLGTAGCLQLDLQRATLEGEICPRIMSRVGQYSVSSVGEEETPRAEITAVRCPHWDREFFRRGTKRPRLPTKRSRRDGRCISSI